MPVLFSSRVRPTPISSFISAATVMAVSLTVFNSPCLAQETGGVAPVTSGSAVIRGKAPVAKELLKVRFPRPKTFTLSNGVAVYVLEDHRLPAVRFSLILRAGAVYEPKPDVADMTAALLTEGTQKRTYQQVALETESLGATLNASADTATTTISIAGLSETTDTLIALMSDALLHPAFPGDRLDRAKFQQTSQTRQRRTNPASLIADLSARVFYGNAPYSRPSPTAEQINAVTREDVVAFYTAYYRPNGALLGVTGDVDANALKRKLEAALAEWKPGPQTAELPKADFKPQTATRIFLVDRPGSAQTVLQFGNIAVRQNDPDYIPLVVANQILGGGSSGRLFQNIRERKGYTYGAYSNLGANPWPGTWGAGASVRTPVTEPAVREFFFEFDRLQNEPISSAESDRAKRSIVGSFARTLESPEGILGRSLDLSLNNLPPDYWDSFPSRIEAVTPADVQRVAKKYLGKNRIQVMVVGEKGQIAEGLKQFGPIESVDPAQLAPGGKGVSTSAAP